MPAVCCDHQARAVLAAVGASSSDGASAFGHELVDAGPHDDVDAGPAGHFVPQMPHQPEMLEAETKDCPRRMRQDHGLAVRALEGGKPVDVDAEPGGDYVPEADLGERADASRVEQLSSKRGHRSLVSLQHRDPGPRHAEGAGRAQPGEAAADD